MRISRTEILSAALLAGAALSSGCGQDADRSLTLPSGSSVVVTLATTSRSDWVEPGEPLAATVAEDVQVDGVTVIPRGLPATVIVTESRDADAEGPARVQLKLESIDFVDAVQSVESEPIAFVGELEPAETDTPNPQPVDADSQVDDPLGSDATLEATGEVTELAPDEGSAIVLPAGQRLVFVTSGELELQRVDLAANES